MSTINEGDTLIIGNRRMLYLGNNMIEVQAFAPERNSTGKLTNSGKGTWRTEPNWPKKELTPELTARWMELTATKA
jgi:hypothetical protein